MSATIPESMRLDDLLKATGYDCPTELQGKTFDQATEGGSSADLEDNKEATIDVSAYTEPVEITPTQGKDGMKKATVTLSNIPSGSGATAYAWEYQDSKRLYLNIDSAPVSVTAIKDLMALKISGQTIIVATLMIEGVLDVYAKVSDTEFTLTGVNGDTYTFTRGSVKQDLVLWELPIPPQ